MSGDASISDVGQNTHEIGASWESRAGGRRGGVDRDAIVAALVAAVNGTAADSIRLVRQSAALGAAFAATSGSAAALINELDGLESVVLERITADAAKRSPPELASVVRALHERAALARRASTAAFGHAVSESARKRVQLARHDIANAIGAVRNAVLLMEDEPGASAREHFRTIAKRNSLASEMLVRSHLSDQSVLTPALGWEELVLPELTGGGDRGASRRRVVTDMAALEAMLAVIREVRSAGDPSDGLNMSFASTGPTTGTLTVRIAAGDDRAAGEDLARELQDVAKAFGLSLEEDAERAELRLVLALLPRDQGHDLIGAHQSHHADSVNL